MLVWSQMYIVGGLLDWCCTCNGVGHCLHPHSKAALQYMQIKRLAKCQQLFANGFSTDAQTMQLLLAMERPGQQQVRKRLSGSMTRASIFEVATSVLGPEHRWAGTAALSDTSTEAAAAVKDVIVRKRRRSARRSQRLSMASLQADMPRSSSVYTGDRRQSSCTGDGARYLLQRMETRRFVNPALLAPTTAHDAGAGVLHSVGTHLASTAAPDLMFEILAA